MKQNEILKILKNGGYLKQVYSMSFDGKIFIYSKDKDYFIDVLNKKQLQSLLDKNIIKLKEVTDKDLLSGVYTFSKTEKYFVYNERTTN